MVPGALASDIGRSMSNILFSCYYFGILRMINEHHWEKNGQGPMINGENAKLGHCLCRGPEGFSTPAGAKKLDPWIFFSGVSFIIEVPWYFTKKNREISSNFYHPNMSPLNSAIFLGYSTAVAKGDQLPKSLGRLQG